ncbi:MAG: hypothetical protein J6D23_02950 [Clostridia bacterium]|nr:hypothetical protein [Clostridia bacterium]
MKTKLIRSLPYVISIALTTIFGFIFSSKIVLGYSSITPMFVSVIMIIQAFVIKYSTSSTNFSNGNLSNEEVSTLVKTISIATIYLIPLNFPLVIFFGVQAKIIVSLLVLFSSYAIGLVAFRLKYSIKIKARLSKENADLQEQLKKEEMGQI